METDFSLENAPTSSAFTSESSSETDFLVALGVDLEESPYEVVGVAGRGGMGKVVEVRHRALRTPFVVKVLVQSDRPDLEDRLRFEAQVLGRLTHRHLLKVIDFDRTPSGRPYLVCEKLEGKTLAEALRERGPFPIEEAVEYVCQALSGLRVAHEARVIHRDIKLSNLFLCDATATRPPIVKVIDFGVVKVGRDAAPGADDVLDSVALPAVPTATGMMVGTPHFMAPEQAKGDRVDARTDLYAMGVVLYRLLTGRAPFMQRDIIKLLLAHVHDAPDAPSKHAPVSLPPALDAAILRALAKEPDDRFASAAEMERCLWAAIDRSPRVRAPTPPVGALKLPVIREGEDETPTEALGSRRATSTAWATTTDALPTAAPTPVSAPIAAPPAAVETDGPAAAVTAPVASTARASVPASAPTSTRSRARIVDRGHWMSRGTERAAFFLGGVLFALAVLVLLHFVRRL